MFVVFLLFMVICQSRADEISRTLGADIPQAQKKFDNLSTVAKIIGFSSVITGLFWAGLSFRRPTKRLWSIVGCVANGILLIWILLNPVAVRVARPTAIADSGKQANPNSMLKRDNSPQKINPRERNQGKEEHLEPKQDKRPEIVPGNKPKAAKPDDSIVIKMAQYLSDMDEFDVKVTQGPPGVDRFTKKGNLGYGEADPRYANGRIRVDGKESPNGLSLCPDSNTFAGVKYRLNKLALTFIASAALNDTVGAPGSPPGVGKIPTALTFQVWGDGKLLWKSEPVDKAGFVQECSVSVAGVEVLDLRIQCPGECTNASGVWVEPRVLLK
jgi:hypothetical protein